MQGQVNSQHAKDPANIAVRLYYLAACAEKRSSERIGDTFLHSTTKYDRANGYPNRPLAHLHSLGTDEIPADEYVY